MNTNTETDSFRSELEHFIAASAALVADASDDEIDPINEARAARERLIAAEEERGRAYARLTLAERAVLDAALDVRLNITEASVEYQKAKAAAAAISADYEDAAAEDRRLNPPAAEILAAEQHAVKAAKAVEAARRAFAAELELAPLAKAAYDAIAEAEAISSIATDVLRSVVKAAAEQDDELRGALGATKAATISRKETVSVAEPLAAYLTLRDWAGDDPARVGAVLGVITINAKAVGKLELPAPVATTTAASFTVSITADKLIK